MRRCVFILSVLIGLAQATPVAAQDYYSALVNISADSINNVLLVDKSKQQMFVVHSEAPKSMEVIRTFRITTGRNDGDKRIEGDLKTPEGIYYIVGSIPDEKLPPKYGPLALILNYPNFVDRLFERTGSNIWIHGRDEEIKDNLTEGCVSLDNGNILELQPYIEINETPVIIADELAKLDEKSYLLLDNYWNNQLSRWATAWQEGDTLSYFNFYSEDFRANGLDYNGFKRKKIFLEDAYPWKDVKVDDIVLLYSKRESKISFTQEYYCPNFISTGTKTLTMVPSDNAWRIVHEDYRSTGPTINKEQFLSDFVEKWQQAWESQDLDRYLSLYDNTFESGEYDYQGWVEHKKSIFNDANRINVQVSNLRFRTTGNKEWEIGFVQSYSSNNYSDRGYKTLRVHGYPNEFKILAEDWRPL